MRIGTANYGFREWSIDNYLFAAAGLGVKDVEIGYTKHGTLQQLYYSGNPVRGLASSQLQGVLSGTETGLSRVKSLAKEAGVNLSSSAVNYRLWGVSSTWLEWAKANIKVDIEIGSELGLDVMRVAEVAYPPGTAEKDVFDEIAGTGKVLNELGKYAEQHGVTIMAENHRASSELMAAVASHFTTPGVALHYDAHNFIRIGEDPVRALRRVKDHVRYCHFKDFRAEDSDHYPTDTWWPSWAVGEGEIDWRPIVEELGSSYNGVVAIEYEKYLHDVLRGMTVGINHIRHLMGELGIEEG